MNLRAHHTQAAPTRMQIVCQPGNRCRAIVRTAFLCALSMFSALANAQPSVQPQSQPETDRGVFGRDDPPGPEAFQRPVQRDEFSRPNDSSPYRRPSTDEGPSGMLPPRLQKSFSVPLQKQPLPERAVVESKGDYLTLVVREGDLGAVLSAISEEMNRNIVTEGNITGTVSISLKDVPFTDALDAILSVNGYRWVIRNDIIIVSSMSGESKLSPRVQGREVRVYQLDFVSAGDVHKTVQDLLSPIGRAGVTESVSDDRRRTREELVVEDTPDYLERVEAYIAQADRPPQQVLIEAHILQIQLRDDNRHGVNLRNVARLANTNVTFQTNGIANPEATPGFVLNVDGADVDSIIEVLQGTTDAKTLAAPKVLAVNGQEARIQIGERLGYLTTTTTQTSTLQDVQFLDLGVVLVVTPTISRDGRILMTVSPQVSSGRINPQTGLPDSETTEVSSSVLLPDGQAMVIGGLIQEETTNQQSKVPRIGDVPLLGKLFQRRNKVKDRSEIIIALTPRIVPYADEGAQVRHVREVQQATSPLTYGPLIRTNRSRYEPKLDDANIFCDPVGKSIDRFPSRPVAYSPYNSEPGYLPGIENGAFGTYQPYQGDTGSRLRAHIPPPSHEQAATAVPLIDQMSHERPTVRRPAKPASADGWSKSRSR